jgi:hypothetical protein
MAVSKITGKLPKGEANGLDALAAELAADFAKGAKRPRFLIVAVACTDVHLERAEDAEDPVTGKPLPPGITATAGIRRIEAVAPDDEDVARRLLVRGMEARAGRVQLDYDTESALLRLAAGEVADPETGEKR